MKFELLSSVEVTLVVNIAEVESDDSNSDDTEESDETKEEGNTNDHAHVTNVFAFSGRCVDGDAGAIDGSIVDLDGAVVDALPALEAIKLVGGGVDGIGDNNPVDAFSARRGRQRAIVGVVVGVSHEMTILFDETGREELQGVDVDRGVSANGKGANSEDLIKPRVGSTSHDTNNQDSADGAVRSLVNQMDFSRALNAVDAMLARCMEVELFQDEHVRSRQGSTRDVVVCTHVDVNCCAEIDNARVVHLLILHDQRHGVELFTSYYNTSVNVDGTLMRSRAAKRPDSATIRSPGTGHEVVVLAPEM